MSRPRQTLLMLQVATDVTSSTGAVSRTWADAGAVFAEITTSGGSVTLAANEVQSGQDVDVKIRWRSGITNDRHRFVFTSLWESPPVAIAYDIQDIGDRTGTRRELVAKCKVRHAEGFRGESA